MGCASDDELEFEVDQPSSPSPEPRAFHVRAVPTPANAFNTLGFQQPSQALPHTLAVFADACCEEFGLSDSLKDDVIQTAKLPLQFLQVRMYARILALGHQLQQSTVAAFLDSADFKENITWRLQAGLLDPGIPYYVAKTTARFVRHMTENPASYNIPLAVQSHFMHGKVFSKAVGGVLSNYRGEIKRKIQKSLTEKQDILTLCQKLAIRGYQITEEHMEQVAFLRMYLIEFNQLSFGPTQPRLSY